MAYHIIAGMDIIFMVFLLFQGLEYLYAVDEDERAQPKPMIKTFYYYLLVMCFTSVFLYSVPRTIMYFFTLWRVKSYGRMKIYFRTRVATLIALGLILLTMFVLILINSSELAVEYDSNRTFIIVLAAGMILVWLGIDLYWSIAVRTYKDSKKGKKGLQAAKRLCKQIDPNDLLLNEEN
jgi:hypothetical protein